MRITPVKSEQAVHGKEAGAITTRHQAHQLVETLAGEQVELETARQHQATRLRRSSIV